MVFKSWVVDVTLGFVLVVAHAGHLSGMWLVKYVLSSLVLVVLQVVLPFMAVDSSSHRVALFC